MMRPMTPNDVLNDIEFELMQGAVSRDELGQGIQTARQYQNKVRAELLTSAADGKIDVADLVGRQFQLNDMVLTLFQVIGARVQSLQIEVRKSAYLKQHRPGAVPAHSESQDSDSTAAPTALDESGEENGGAPAVDIAMAEAAMVWMPDFSGVDAVGDEDVAEAMSPDALDVPIDVRPVHVPLLGWIFTRMRTALHSLVHFYVERLAKKQAAVNRVYGEHIVHLEQINQQQQSQIEVLHAQIEELRKRLAG